VARDVGWRRAPLLFLPAADVSGHGQPRAHAVRAGKPTAKGEI